MRQRPRDLPLVPQPRQGGGDGPHPENPLLKGVHLPESLRITGDLECLRGANLVVSAPPSFAVRDTAKKMAPYLTDKSVVVSVSKGIERDTNLRLSQVIREETGDICKVAVLSGPSHAEEVGIRLPTGCVAACPIWRRPASSRTPS